MSVIKRSYKSRIVFYTVIFLLACLIAEKSERVQESKRPIPVVTVHEVLRARDITEPEVECLALNVYFEARNQDIESQAAVAMVVLNRAQDPFWPNHICDVVKQGSYSDGSVRRNKCQFSWYCDGLSDRPYEKETWTRTLKLAEDSYYLWSSGRDITNGATNYHANYIQPKWGSDFNMEYVATIGDHKFYRWDTQKKVAIN